MIVLTQLQGARFRGPQQGITLMVVERPDRLARPQGIGEGTGAHDLIEPAQVRRRTEDGGIAPDTSRASQRQITA